MNYTAECANIMNTFRQGDVLCDSRYGKIADCKCLLLVTEEPTYPYVYVIDARGERRSIHYSDLINNPDISKIGEVDFASLEQQIKGVIISAINKAAGERE